MLQSISAIASHRLSRNESLVAVGFADGSVTTLKVYFSLKRLASGLISCSMDHVASISTRAERLAEGALTCTD